MITLVLVFWLGLAVGSFVNVVVYRLNHGGNPLKGRSFCPKCQKKIVWHDNLPLVSFLFLKGQCRNCHSPISRQYPLVELTTGLAFVGTYWWWLTQGSDYFNLFFLLLMASAST